MTVTRRLMKQIVMCAPALLVVPFVSAQEQAEPALVEEPVQTPLTAGEEKPEEKPELTDEQKVAELNAQMQKLQEEVQKAERELRNKQRQERENAPVKGIEEVRAAVLPENPTRTQCEAYIATLREAVDGRNRRSSEDLVVDKLRKVPREFIDLIIDEYSRGGSMSFYATCALSEKDNDAIRKRITETVDQYPNNINIIIAQGWCEQAKPAIRRVIESDAMPSDWQQNNWWFQAIVELQDPTMYSKLHQLALNSSQWEKCIEMLTILPDYDMAHTINACIAKQQKNDNSHSMIMHGGYMRTYGNGFSVETAKLAAEYGSIDGLSALIDMIPETRGMALEVDWNAAEPRIRVFKYIHYRGSNNDIKAWFKKNRGKLVFDHLTKRFILPQSDEQAQDTEAKPAEPADQKPDTASVKDELRIKEVAE